MVLRVDTLILYDVSFQFQKVMVSLSSMGLYFHHSSYTNSWWGHLLILSEYPIERATCNIRKIQCPLSWLWTIKDREKDGGDRVSHDTWPHLPPHRAHPLRLALVALNLSAGTRTAMVQGCGGTGWTATKLLATSAQVLEKWLAESHVQRAWNH